MKYRIKTILLILVICLISILCSCGNSDKNCTNITKNKEQRSFFKYINDWKVTRNYIETLNFGDTVNVDKLKTLGIRIHRLNKNNKVYAVGIYYITVDPSTNIIKSIWSNN